MECGEMMHSPIRIEYQRNRCEDKEAFGRRDIDAYCGRERRRTEDNIIVPVRSLAPSFDSVILYAL